jgi:hypothetical protein
MKKLIVAAAVCIAMPGLAWAAEAPKPEKCCCEKMKEKGKDCCAEMKKGEHENHSTMQHDHPMDAPKS